jgi:hypothetical protein
MKHIQLIKKTKLNYLKIVDGENSRMIFLPKTEEGCNFYLQSILKGFDNLKKVLAGETIELDSINEYPI